MDINFNLNNSKVIKINQNTQSIGNRLKKLMEAKDKLRGEMIKWEINGGMTDYKNIDKIFDKKLETLRKNTSRVEEMVRTRLNAIEKQSNKLKEKEFTYNELQREIERDSNVKQPTEASLNAKREHFKDAFLVSKIVLKTSKPIPDSFRRQVVQINNEITHINYILINQRELGDEIVKDYNTARIEAIKSAYQQKRAAISMDKYQSIVELISGFNVVEMGNLALERVNEFHDVPFYRHINCAGKTGLC